jgi:hypothetical protein
MSNVLLSPGLELGWGKKPLVTQVIMREQRLFGSTNPAAGTQLFAPRRRATRLVGAHLPSRCRVTL